MSGMGTMIWPDFPPRYPSREAVPVRDSEAPSRPADAHGIRLGLTPRREAVMPDSSVYLGVCCARCKQPVKGAR